MATSSGGLKQVLTITLVAASALLSGCATGPTSFYFLNEDDFHAGLAAGEDPDGWGQRTPLAAVSGFLVKRHGMKAHWREEGDPKYVSEARRVELARILLEAGANPDKVSSGMGGTAATAPPLHHAAANCQPDLAGLLLEYGADPTTTTPHYGNVLVNLVMLCTRAPESYEVARVVIDHTRQARGQMAASSLMEGRSAINGIPPLQLAVWMNRPGVVAALVAQGVDLNRKIVIDSVGEEWTALHVASAMSRDDLVEMLLAAGADPNVRSGRGELATDVAGRYDGDGGTGRMAKVVLAGLGASKSGSVVSAAKKYGAAVDENEFENGWKRFPQTDPAPEGWAPPLAR